jgi:hypothetical protein
VTKPRVRERALAATVLTAAFAWLLLNVELPNDHFDRISRGRQILVYGERPFVDFRDPGYFLTLYTSAAVQALSGGRLLGEAVFDSAAIAVAVMLTFVLAARAADSTGIGLVAAIFMLIVAPRYYDYDKVLFYTAGLALAWRYADDRRLRTLLVAAMVTVAAGLFRYDNGVFLFAATLTTLVMCHWRAVDELLRRGAAYTAGVALGLVPALITWQQTVGVSEVLRQVRAYAQLEGERTGIFKAPIPRVDAGRSILSSLVSPENHAVLLYYAIVALLPAAVTALLWRWYRTESERSMPHEAPKMAATVVLGVLVAAFILRDPIVARLGAAAPMAAILAAWLAAPAIPPRWARNHARLLVIVLGGSAMLVSALILTGGSPTRVREVLTRMAAGAARVRELTRVPPSLALLPDAPATEGLVGYVRACTPPGSRVLVGGFVPQLYFFAERGFAGGMPVFFGGHWSSVQDQERTIEQLRREFVPLAIVDPGFSSTYDRVGAFLASTFVQAGVSSFGNPRASAGGYQVLLRRGVGSMPVDSRWNLPCLSGWLSAESGRS